MAQARPIGVALRVLRSFKSVLMPLVKPTLTQDVTLASNSLVE
jgi:hypothetical protein